MGTRNMIYVVHNKEYKVAQYCQWDGYPEGQGKRIVQFILNGFTKHKFIQNLKKIMPIDKENVESYFENWINPEKNICDTLFNKKLKEKYYHFTRDCGADILELIQLGEIDEVYLNLDFINDSLFCEYAYVLDLDNDVLEVYEGFNKTKLEKNERFYKDVPDENGYYPCKLLINFYFDELKSVENFLDKCEKELKNES